MRKEENMKRFLIFVFALCLCVPPCVVASAQEKSPAPAPPVKQPLVAASDPAPSAEAPKPSAEFLKKFDRFLALHDARTGVRKKADEYLAAERALSEQINTLVLELQAAIPKDHTWDAAQRAFVKVPPAAAAPEVPSGAEGAKPPEKKP